MENEKIDFAQLSKKERRTEAKKKNNIKFFHQMASVLADGYDLTLSMRKTGNNITVTVLPSMKKNNDVKEDKNKVQIKPLVLSGSPGELDQEFLQVITRAKEKTTGVVNTLVDYQKHLDNQVDKKRDKNKKKKGKGTGNQSGNPTQASLL